MYIVPRRTVAFVRCLLTILQLPGIGAEHNSILTGYQS